EYIAGTESALDEPDRVVLTESTARRMFGGTDVVGKIISAGQNEFEVGAVIRDLPKNTHFTFECLVSASTFPRVEVWDDINAYTYVQLMRGVEMSEIDTTIASTINSYLELISEDYGFKYEPVIQRIDEIHLGGYLDEDFSPKRSRNYVYIIVSVIVLFLLTGLFNYLNLALAELTTQVKKIAILRTFGGISADHRRVALTDVFLCLVIVAPLVVLIMALMLSYPGFLPAIDNGVWSSLEFLMFTAGLAITIVICSALNSLVISKSEIVLSGKSSGTQNGFTARKILVAAQLSFAIIMIGLISVIFDQFRFVNDGDKGFDDHDVLVITRVGKYNDVQSLQESIRKMSGVKMVAGTSFYPGGAVETKDIFSIETPDGMKNQLVNFIYGDVEYPALLNLKLVEGRFFDENFSTDKKGAYIINETAAREFGWADPIGKKIEGPLNADQRAGQVIGVVEDFHFESMHTRIQPMIIFRGDESWGANFIYVKTEPMQSTALIENIEREHRKLFPELPFDFGYLDAKYRGLYQHDYEIRDIFRWGLIISIIVSGLGIFSISALMLSLRTKEMGIRKVVGAANSDLFLRHLKPFVIFFVIALVIGLPVIFYLSERWLNNFAYHVSLSTSYFVVPAIVTVLIILGASVYHAIRGARINPVDILKSE
ncbi:MAG TPA: ABC transporter permease, partial [Cyclobacteriaceae bacterium]|nr:ABC transporter permease [Cyclobacteriaceae bacterium]